MFKKVKKIILERCHQLVTPSTKIEELDLDSLGRLELIMDIEDALDMNIPESIITNEMTIQEVINLGKPDVSTTQKAKQRNS
jgi:acyl carrier protein